MSLSKPFEDNKLQNASQIIKTPNGLMGSHRSAPVLPPRPVNSSAVPSEFNTYNSYMPYSGYNGYNSYTSMGAMPYRSSIYNSFGSSYGGYNSYGNFGNYPNYVPDDHERRFIQYAEESSRNTFASVEGIVRAFNSLAMMLDNTFFAMTSSFRAVLSVAENFGRLRTMFGHIWYSVNMFRFFSWFYRKLLRFLGYRVPHSTTSMAWKQATSSGGIPSPSGGSPGSSWPTLAFLGMLLSAPYIISRFLPKYEDKGDPVNWKTSGIRAKAAFDFIATSPNELTIHTNDFVLLAPTYIQEELHLKNSGWAFAVCKGKSGVVPLNYLVINKTRPTNSNSREDVPIPRILNNNNNNYSTSTKNHTKRVSFGENQIFENVDIDDYVTKKVENKSSPEMNKGDGSNYNKAESSDKANNNQTSEQTE